MHAFQLYMYVHEWEYMLLCVNMCVCVCVCVCVIDRKSGCTMTVSMQSLCDVVVMGSRGSRAAVSPGFSCRLTLQREEEEKKKRINQIHREGGDET